MVRPSLKLTLNVSSVTVTVSTLGTTISTAEILIPSLHQTRAIGSDDLLNPADLGSGKAAAPLQSNWVKPKLCDVFISFYVHMRGFIAICGVEEKTEGPDSQNRWHVVICISRFTGKMDRESRERF